ncbi:MAG: hypothetical protein IPO85_00600 [Saprospiraceae bacterium]|uniref:Uncharacterized protein n=1 Tax=Candidatus Defluviibacterium haderslevense TaxID=2981993 RepID=A0A9D7S617_9BACT|nr:hypothetical protein [Candidatus Defluviibacterium haderslevense]
MNNFYKLPKAFQWIVAILLLIIGFLPALVIIEKGNSQPLFYLLFLIYIPVGQFAATPFFTLVGIYKYYSPMLLGYMANDNQIDLHSGGSFDYLFVMRKFKSGIEFKNSLLIYHLEGLLNIIKLIENKKIPNTVNIIGTSYFFNDRTLKKMGFEIENPSLFYRANLFVNFIDLAWMYSLSQGKLSIPKVWYAKKASISGAKLVESKKVIEVLYDKMKSKTTA